MTSILIEDIKEKKEIPTKDDLEQIKSISLHIKAISINDKETFFEKKFPVFKEAYPSLYEKACDSNYSTIEFKKNIHIMFSQWENHINGLMNYKDASGKVSTILFKEYHKE
jgi:hypothetical protein